MRLFILFITFTLISSEVFSQIRKKKNITYVAGSTSDRHQLDVYYPKDTQQKKDVFVFFHGGSWRSGKKKTYKFLGKRMARKGFVTVIANYTLAPNANYHTMTDDCAQVVSWVSDHIHNYGGDSARITVSGHSAGGHLAALITLDNSFKKLGQKNPIYKTILIDAFGLDMKTYFEKYDNRYSKNLMTVFTNDPKEWKAASPIYLIDKNTRTPFLILRGSKTYPAIFESSEDFYTKIQSVGGKAQLNTIKGKKHIAMIAQLFFGWNKMYDTMIDFIKSPKDLPE